MWCECQCDNSPQRDQMTQKLITIGHCTAFNNEQIQYCIVTYKRPQNEYLLDLGKN